MTPEIQDERLVTLAPKIQKSEAWIHWQQSASEVHNQVRALVMGPYASTLRGRLGVKIHRSCLPDEQEQRSFGSGFVPGEIIVPEAGRLYVGCGQGAIEILELQPESRGRMTAREYLKGYPLHKGDKFTAPPSGV